VNGCEFGGADSSTFALLAEPDPMVLVPFRLEEANVSELKKQISLGV
jgi:hypothetical protein